MTRLRVLPLLVLSFLCIPDTLPAQEEKAQPVVTEGSRVRVTSPLLEKRLRGEVVSLTGGYLVLMPDGRDAREARLPLDQVTTIDVSLGKKSVLAQSIAIGFGAGFALCFIPGLASGEVALGSLYGIMVGWIGMGMGAVFGHEKRDLWEEARLPEPVVSLVPERNRAPAIRIGLRLRI